MVIDVRSEREFHAMAIEHAVNVPLPPLAHRIGELVSDKTTPLVVFQKLTKNMKSNQTLLFHNMQLLAVLVVFQLLTKNMKLNQTLLFHNMQLLAVLVVYQLLSKNMKLNQT